MTRSYKNRRTYFYQRKSTANDRTIKSYTEVISPKSIVSANSTTGAYFILKILLMRQVLRDRAISKHTYLLYSTTSGFALSIRRNG